MAQELSVKEYAVKHHLPIYNVVKMVRLGEIPSELRKVNGKEEYVILADTPPKVAILKAQTPIDYKAAYFELKEKYDALVKKMG